MKLQTILQSDVILLCGLYGSGKSEFANSYLKNADRSRISRSEIRRLIYEMAHFNMTWTPDKFNEEDEILVKHVERKIYEHYLHNKKKILMVNTFMTKKSRQKYIEIAKSMKRTISAIFLDTTIEECMARNQKKNSEIGSSILVQLNTRKELPSTAEGFLYVAAMKNFSEPEQKPGINTDGLIEVSEE